MSGSREPCLFIILGGTGDLALRSLFPGLFNISMQGLIGEGNLFLGVARDTTKDDVTFRSLVHDALQSKGVSSQDISGWCNASLHYQSIGDGKVENFRALSARIEALEKEYKLSGNRIFYLALPPGAFPDTITGLGETGLNRSLGWTRAVIEKPFGDDLSSARELNQLIHRYFDESQVFRIDHYLGKETVQNLLVFRFSNAIFESLWNRDRVKSVQITVAEELGIGQRTAFYDKVGALRDIVQNHITQLLAIIAMEVPSAFEADAVRYEKIKMLRSISPVSPKDVVFGQYTRGKVDDIEVPGYSEEPGVSKDSKIETFVAMKLEIDTWRWQGVPFFLRTGKRLPKKLTQIVVTFRRPPVRVFDSLGFCQISSNMLVMTLQPDEGFCLYFDVKTPGEPFEVATVPLSFQYKEAFGQLPDAYETLLLDILTGDQTLFVHADEVEASWKLYSPLLEEGLEVFSYEAGTWGPPEAERLLHKSGHLWQIH
jgi:glucose-6-phosphate 1-dehydrogenase